MNKKYYWEVKFDNGTIEYWESKNYAYNFKKMSIKDGTIKVIVAKPITKIVYLFCKWYHKQNFTVILD